MKKKKSLQISLPTFFLFLTIFVILFMIYYIYTEKTNYNKEIVALKTNTASMQNTIDNLRVEINSLTNASTSNEIKNDEKTTNTMNSNKIKNNEKTTNTYENNTEESSIAQDININKKVEYEFTSADNAAAQGYPKILKIFKLTDSEMEFHYNSGFDFNKNTIDRQISGTAKIISNEVYEFEEILDGHKYKLLFEFDEYKETVKIREFDNENEIGWGILFR